jgi:hypothetical protein
VQFAVLSLAGLMHGSVTHNLHLDDSGPDDSGPDQEVIEHILDLYLRGILAQP